MTGRRRRQSGADRVGLEIRSITVNFGGLAALADVSLDVRGGSIAGLIGPNGAGKTTLFNVITGMQRPTSGAVLLNGRDLRRVSPYRRSRLGLGRTFQRLELFGTLSVRENIAAAASMSMRPLSRRQRGRSVQQTAEGVLRRLNLDRVADVRADSLPTGTGRLVELGRALAIRPQILLLDEPASGQTVEETRQFAFVLRTLSDEGMAVLLVEHDMDLVMNVCSHIFVLDYGRIIASGAPEQIQADPDVKSAYLGSMAEVSHD
jgi:branched-chain amino acid transport system ATP-binding protein